MVVSGHASSAKQVCQPCGKPKKVKKAPTTAIPQEWALTWQQQGFIDMFMGDDVKKQ